MSEQKKVQQLAWGLDLSNPDVTTQEEIDEFQRMSAQQIGGPQPGLDFWLNERPDVLKRYRSYADKLRITGPGRTPGAFTGNPFATLISSAQFGFRNGISYAMIGLNRALSKAELLELFALAFRYVGPRGMAVIAEAVRDHAWQEPDRPMRWPEGWAADPEAFRSGIDFSTPELSDAERQKVEDWYLRYLGEVPGHISFLGRHRPEVLKAYRNRFENTLRLLPKQVEPYVLIQNSVERTFPQGLREGVLMARGFGMPKDDVLEALSWGTFYGSGPALDLVNDEITGILDSWPGSAQA